MKIGDLKHTPYNPRVITQSEQETLKKDLLEMGDISGIVFNRKTGHLVGGNQRTGIFNDINPNTEITITERYDEPTKQGTVARGFFIYKGEKFVYREVEWEEIKEKVANIAANQVGGSWDNEKLEEVLKDIVEQDQELAQSVKTGFDEDFLSSLITEKKNMDGLMVKDFINKREDGQSKSLVDIFLDEKDFTEGQNINISDEEQEVRDSVIFWFDKKEDYEFVLNNLRLEGANVACDPDKLVYIAEKAIELGIIQDESEATEKTTE